MSIWEKLGLKRGVEKVDIDSEIRRLGTVIPEMEQAVIEETDDMKRYRKRQELKGLRDKLSLFEEKRRREEEKAVEQLKQ